MTPASAIISGASSLASSALKDDGPLQFKRCIPLAKKLFFLGLLIPLLPWLYAILFTVSRHREESGEDRYWVWACAFALVIEVLLAIVVTGIMLYDMGLLVPIM